MMRDGKLMPELAQRPNKAGSVDMLASGMADFSLINADFHRCDTILS